MATTVLKPEELFDAQFMESVSRLRIIAKRVAHGGRPAEQRSKDLGSGVEFRDFRPYVAGDDFRAIDWNIYRRLGRVFLRLFEELEDLPVYIVPDTSRSLWLESPPRIHAGLRTALALSAVALNQHDSVGLLPFSDDIGRIHRALSGKARVHRIAHHLAELRPGDGTDFEKSCRHIEALNLRPGLMVIISDFFDPKGLEAVTAGLKRLRHRLLLVPLVKKADREPELFGDLRLVDCETSQTQDVSMTPAVVEQYRLAYDRFMDGLAKFAHSRQSGLMAVNTEEPVIPQLAGLFESGTMLV